MNVKAMFFLAALIGFHRQADCSTNVTLVIGGSVTHASVTVDSNQVAQVVSAYLINGAGIKIDFNRGSFSYAYNTSLNAVTPDPRPVVAGPATITVFSFPSNPGAAAFCTVELSEADGSFLPSNAVVIPADSGGPVNIILESSADLVNWTAALPGLYGTSTKNRFFRVRAVRAP
jgi:hypothetical protein